MTWRKAASGSAAGPFLSLIVATVALAYFAGGGAGTGEASSGTLESPSPVTAASQGASARVTWTTVPSPSGISTDVTYTIDRSGDDGSTWVPTNSTCTGRQPRPTPACDDAPPVSGMYRYRVTAFFRTWTSSAATSTPVTIVAVVPDNTPPTSTITFPTSGTYNATAYLNGCSTPAVGDICGTASDPGLTASGVSRVRVSIQRSSDSLYWNGTAWVPLATWNDATGTTSWSYGFSASNLTTGVTYTVRSQAIDNRDNAQTTPSSASFTVDTAAPTATDIQSINGSASTAGLIDAGDRVVYTFSEAMDPNTILAGWTGTTRSVTVSFNDVGNNDTMTVTGTNLGTVALGGNYMNSTRTTTASMVMSGSTITLTLSASPPPGQVNAVASSTMVWSPSTSAKDSAGNNMSAATATQSGAPKQNF